MPPIILGGIFHNGCSAVSYFSTLVGSIIGAGRLSFRVRDGSGRFPVAVSAVTLLCCWVVFGGGVCVVGRGRGLLFWCGVVACVSFRPVSASSLCALPRVQVWSIDPVVCGGPYPT
jgi:hypothetical protein